MDLDVDVVDVPHPIAFNTTHQSLTKGTEILVLPIVYLWTTTGTKQGKIPLFCATQGRNGWDMQTNLCWIPSRPICKPKTMNVVAQSVAYKYPGTAEIIANTNDSTKHALIYELVESISDKAKTFGKLSCRSYSFKVVPWTLSDYGPSFSLPPTSCNYESPLDYFQDLLFAIVTRLSPSMGPLRSARSPEGYPLCLTLQFKVGYFANKRTSLGLPQLLRIFRIMTLQLKVKDLWPKASHILPHMSNLKESRFSREKIRKIMVNQKTVITDAFNKQVEEWLNETEKYDDIDLEIDENMPRISGLEEIDTVTADVNYPVGTTYVPISSVVVLQSWVNLLA